MLFNSVQYLIFLNLVLIGLCIISSRKYQHLFLLLASYYFFWVSSNIYILLLFSTSLSSYYIGIAIHSSEKPGHRKMFLALACIILLGTLGYFKYYNFAAESLNSLLYSLNIVPPFSGLAILLPIGISFYTFEALIYVIDIHRGTIKPAGSLREYLMYMAFFPKLIAGPIVRAWEFLPQLKKPVVFTRVNIQPGVTLILWGLFKKVVVADNIGQYADFIFADPVGAAASSFEIWSGILAFGIQIFCDFSGYTDIAIGTALVMGLILPQNFNRPYFSASPALFWRNWHITLSRIIKDYIYIPLGGSRKGRGRTYLNLLVAWGLSGLWHGASWNFLLWGGFHGLLLSGHRFVKEASGRFRNTEMGPATVFLCALVTQYLVFLGWIFFRVKDPAAIGYCVGRYLVPDLLFDPLQVILVIAAIGMAAGTWLFLRTGRGVTIGERVWQFNHIAYLGTLSLRWWIVACILIGLCIIMFGPNAAPQFLYFQF